MTTIAIKDGVVAADSQLTDGNTLLQVQKVHRLPDGGVVTAAGSWGKAYAAIRWMLDGQKGEPPEFEDATLVVVRPDKSIWVAENQFPAYPLVGFLYAAGCGADLARLLMAQGKTPAEAVSGACELDALSSGPIHTMTVYPPRGDGLEVYEVTKAAGRKRRAKR